MNKFEFEINEKGVRKAPETFKKYCTRAMGQIMELAEQEARRNAPFRTGRLSGKSGGRGGIVSRLETHENKIDGILTATALSKDQKNYALFVSRGTGIYGPSKNPITPRRAKALVFEIAGKKVFAKSVKGQKPNPFMEKGMEVAIRHARGIFDEQMGIFNREVQ